MDFGKIQITIITVRKSFLLFEDLRIEKRPHVCDHPSFMNRVLNILVHVLYETILQENRCKNVRREAWRLPTIERMAFSISQICS